MSKTKDTNPKDAIGSRKAPLSVVPMPVMYEVGLGMLEGACKYGRHNYREIGVRASVYYDAAMRHTASWWEGEDIDPDSGLNHLVKAMASLAVLRDAMIRDKWYDDRPPTTPGFVAEMNRKAGEIIDRYPDPKPPYLAAPSSPETQETRQPKYRCPSCNWPHKKRGRCLLCGKDPEPETPKREDRMYPEAPETD
jgi:hypothetical protein